MRNGLVCIAAAVAILFSAGAAEAVLLYDMEGASPPSGFVNNGVISVTQDTIGTTQGSNSMRVEILGQTFVGAITPTVPAGLGNPPGVESILYDLTINAGEEYAGAGFADMGVTIYGCQGATCGLSAQFLDFESVAAKGVGTHTDLQIDLATSIGPNFAGKSFNQIIADGDLTAVTHFQFYFNQSFDTVNPVIAYIDNVRTIVPEPAAGALLCMGLVGVGLTMRRKS